MVMPRKAAMTRLMKYGRILPPCDGCGMEFTSDSIALPDAPEPVEPEEPEAEDTNEEMSTLYLLDEAEKELAQLMAEPVLKDAVS